MDWDSFLTPYKQAVDELKVKLKGIREQYQKKHLSIHRLNLLLVE